jgi:hypothetical protein
VKLQSDSPRENGVVRNSAPKGPRCQPAEFTACSLHPQHSGPREMPVHKRRWLSFAGVSLSSSDPEPRFCSAEGLSGFLLGEGAGLRLGRGRTDANDDPRVMTPLTRRGLDAGELERSRTLVPSRHKVLSSSLLRARSLGTFKTRPALPTSRGARETGAPTGSE